MNSKIEDQLRVHYRAVADELELRPMSFDELCDRADGADATTSASSTSSTRHGRQPAAWLAAAAALAAVVAGLVAITVVRTDDANPATLLTSVNEVDPSDWVIATALPDGLVWRYALEFDGPGTNGHTAVYGSDRLVGGSERLHIALEPAVTVKGSEAVDIDGTTWQVATIGTDSWVATRRLSTTAVTVRDRGAFDQVDRALLAGLLVASDDGLPSPPLGDPDQLVEVATTELDGLRYSLRAQESNGFWCFAVVSGTGGSRSCGGVVDSEAPITIESGSFSTAEGSSESEVMRAGTTSSDVARIEMQIQDGSIIEVIPTDLSRRFDRRFWIAAATVEIGPEPHPIEARAYDTAGDLLGAATPPP